MTEVASPELPDDRMLRERLDAVCATLGPMFALNLFSTGLIASFFWRPSTAPWLAAWLVVNTIIVTFRGLSARAYLARRFGRLGERGWAGVLIASTAATGVSWSIPLCWMVAMGTDDQIMLVVCVSLGALSMAMINMTYWPMFVAFIVPVITGAAVGFSLSDRDHHAGMAAGAAAIAVGMLIVSRRMSGQVLRAVRLAETNRQLVESLALRGHELERAFAALERISLTDPLTGLANRRARDDRLEREWARAARAGAPLSVVAIDVDGFKRYNDTHGHDEGDRCLRAVGAVLQRATRGAIDMAARHGGEEFMLILPGLSSHAAASVAERLRMGIARCRAEFDLPERVTVSLGVATASPGDGAGLRGLTIGADAALYRAKLAGRNRCEVADGARHGISAGAAITG